MRPVEPHASKWDETQVPPALAGVPAAFAPAAGAAAGSFLFRARFVHGQVATVQRAAVEGIDGGLGFLGRSHGDESKPARPTGGAVGHEVGFDDGAVGRKGVLQIVFGGIEGKVSYE